MSIFNQMSLPEVYDRFLVEPLFRPFAEEVLNRLHPKPDDSLDVACRTGIVARCARRRLGPQARIVGVDAAPPMLAVARQADSTIDWRDGNAMALPVLAQEQFSLVACHQGCNSSKTNRLRCARCAVCWLVTDVSLSPPGCRRPTSRSPAICTESRKDTSDP
jgi:SAM-dependent methyltransferase